MRVEVEKRNEKKRSRWSSLKQRTCRELQIRRGCKGREEK